MAGGAVPVFARGPDTLIRASFFERAGTTLDQQLRHASRKSSIGHAVVADLPLFIVEMYTPREIVEARRPFSAETAEDALLAAKRWINDGRHNATNFRVVDLDGTIMFD